MTTRTRTSSLRARWAGLLLAALVAVLAMLLGAGTASASGLPAAQTRVGAIHPTVTVSVGVAKHIAAGQRRSRAPSQLQVVSGHCVAANAGERSVAIGEDMTNRVEPFAKKIGADTYKADPSAPRERWMENNRSWIRKQVDDGCTIYDCGPAPGRANYPGPTSPYYKMELDELRNYPNYIRVWLGE